MRSHALTRPVRMHGSVAFERSVRGVAATDRGCGKSWKALNASLGRTGVGSGVLFGLIDAFTRHKHCKSRSSDICERFGRRASCAAH